uniref:AlNc14C103G6120 protein n=1 Tax=Albugo laibachii Nc14 TaxID=890382 RepID=F0WHR3_9STRA|nr:AlNc14C103G6120 [Albugo laibachii Nc14]CCA23706.1 AlNc14C204G8756 [Albugo laibachii Nc14]|eukprot:CCA23706.1 AlNc14C204G8756 [Albugo laibachii Nc14]
MSSELENKWQIAMNVELEALHHNEGWVVETKTFGDVFTERFKARLVACYNEQVFGADYGLTFAAIMKISTVKAIIRLALR